MKNIEPPLLNPPDVKSGRAIRGEGIITVNQNKTVNWKKE